MSRLFLDCDGVLADFDAGFEERFGTKPRAYEAKHGASRFWNEIRLADPPFYLMLPLKPDAPALYGAVAHLEPTILTGKPQGDWAEPQKRAWAGVHFPDVPVIVCLARDKPDYCRPGDVLVDDQDKHRQPWEAKGGIFVHHTSAAASVPRVLAALGPR
ncbi:MAG: hypothetical protein ABW221_27835 [Vicinamibacteria bacterium]